MQDITKLLRENGWLDGIAVAHDDDTITYKQGIGGFLYFFHRPRNRPERRIIRECGIEVVHAAHTVSLGTVQGIEHILLCKGKRN